MQELKPEKVRQTYVSQTISQHGFHSQRQQTTHSLDANTKTKIKHQSDLVDHQVILNFHIHHPVRTLLSSFREILKEKNFICVEIRNTQLLAIRMKFMDRFHKIFCCQEPPKFLITIETCQFKSRRTVAIKPLKSHSNFSSLSYKPHQIAEEINNIGSTLQQLDNLAPPPLDPNAELDAQYQQDFYSLEATSYYMYSKFLVDKNYELGKKMQLIQETYKSCVNFQDLEKVQLKYLNRCLNELSDDLLQGFNCSRKQLQQILGYCRKSVQQYFYNVHEQMLANNQATSYGYFSQEKLKHDKERLQLKKTVPQTFSQCSKLQKANISMDIYRQIFLICHFFKAESQVLKLSEEAKNRAKTLIKYCFSGLINEKVRLLKCSGYHQQHFSQYVSSFNNYDQISI